MTDKVDRPVAAAGERERALLYLSPVVPALHGNGLAMRAGTVLELLAAHYRVYLLIRPLYSSPEATLPSDLVRRCEQVATLPIVRRDRPGMVRRNLMRYVHGPPRHIFDDVRFCVVHAFRLAMLADAGPYIDAAHPPRRHLDLDDLESRTQRRLSALYRLHGDRAGSAISDAAANRAEFEEQEILASWDRVYVCSEVDRRALLERGGDRVRTLPNAVRLPSSLPMRRPGGPFTFLFVGTLGYFPNEDGLRYFCHEVVPAMRRKTYEPFRLVVVGFGANPSVLSLGDIPEVEVIGMVHDVAPWYGDADVVVVPVRAGGGTRIKVLEAFAYRRPVVSTSLGCEGIAVRAGEHVLLADGPEDMAEQCVRLMRDPGLRAQLATQADALVRERYTIDAVAARHGPDLSLLSLGCGERRASRGDAAHPQASAVDGTAPGD